MSARREACHGHLHLTEAIERKYESVGGRKSRRAFPSSTGIARSVQSSSLIPTASFGAARTHGQRSSFCFAFLFQLLSRHSGSRGTK